MRAVLITGATGFLGTQVTRLILEQTDFPVIVLVRGRNLSDAKLRLERVWWDWPCMTKEIGERIRVVNGDLLLPGFGLSDAACEELAGSTGHIIHLAADIQLNAPLDQLRQINVEGTRNVLEFARKAHRLHGLTRFSYVSTAYIAGGRKGFVPEDALTGRHGFSNHYEQSKFEAEALVRDAGKELPVSVFRPGMVIGDSKTGAVKTFNTMYFPLRLYLTGKLKFLPVNPSLKVNMVPCDYVAQAIAKLTFDPRAEGLNFHLTLPPVALPTVKEMILLTREWAAEKLSVQLPKPVFLPVKLRRFKWLSRFFRTKSPVHSLLSLASYLEEDRIYGRDNLDCLMGPYQESWREFFPQILAYAVDRGFMHRSERTVHEQAYYRLSGKSRPVRFHDVIPGRILSRSSDEVRREIATAVSSMRQMGIRPGERVAVVGYNSSRYFTIDVAVGLSGAVSVPLYYSSPIGELMEIVCECGVRLIFAGVPEILEKLAAADLNIPVVSFCRETPQISLPENYLGWNEFLSLAADAAPNKTSGEDPAALVGSGTEPTADVGAPVSFGDIATLRYTSGTTGRPKGAAFTHAGLRSMAESLASLPPWKARTRRIVYLSFLPMNHVVEGILASYAINYAPAPIEIYYLEDFRSLQKALPKIRPTVFFSVPRFYEKVWDSASKSTLGRQYLKTRDGLWKRFLGRIFGQAVKRAAGIGRCSQLIVGSAPVSERLIRSFREIGIEIHNAYGLTEAPLITLNRSGANRIGTVGEPLPDTLIKIAADGEVLVKGPQVMKGYFQDSDEPPRGDGWLHTGDLGSLTDDNFLILSGRKKEVMINSYGKNINPVKIEMMLREATGIEHVMLLCDNRPYCAALFWDPAYRPEADAAIEAAVREVNRELSRPEQVKRWAVLTDELSIEGGGLTANLKMKRSAIVSGYAAIIDSLYDQKPTGLN